MSNEGKLCIHDLDESPRLAWYFEEDGDYGAVLGEEVFTRAQLDSSSTNDREHVLATLTAAKTEGVRRDSNGYYWPSLTAARAALRTIKAMLKADPGGKWPEWAIKAQEAGWKPPKGWKP